MRTILSFFFFSKEISISHLHMRHLQNWHKCHLFDARSPRVHGRRNRRHVPIESIQFVFSKNIQILDSAARLRFYKQRYLEVNHFMFMITSLCSREYAKTQKSSGAIKIYRPVLFTMLPCGNCGQRTSNAIKHLCIYHF